jgi:hypothetical protein
MSQTERQRSADAHREQMRLAMASKLRAISSSQPEAPVAGRGSSTGVGSVQGGGAPGAQIRQWLFLGVTLLVLVSVMWVSFRNSPEHEALQVWCAPPPPDAMRYPRLGIAVCERAWLRATPRAPDGPALFTALDSPVFSTALVIDAADWRDALAALQGMAWQDGLWSAPPNIAKPGGKSPTRTVAEIAKILSITIPDERSVRAIIALLNGTPTGSAPDFARRLLQDGKPPARLRLLPFNGKRGVLAVAVGRPEYKMVDRAYTGMLLQFEDPDWPVEWRILELAPTDAP